MSFRKEQCKKICRILDDVLANRPTERDSLVVAVQLAFKSQSEHRWIPCSERLPEEGRYLVARCDYVSKTNFTDILWFEKNVWWNRQYTGDYAVTAWMPLPEPYKMDEVTE